jgi:hypothetical protein
MANSPLDMQLLNELCRDIDKAERAVHYIIVNNQTVRENPALRVPLVNAAQALLHAYQAAATLTHPAPESAS